MNAKEIIEEVKKYLPDYLKNDSSFKQIINTYLDLVKTGEVFVEVSSYIYEKVKEFQNSNNISTSGTADRILNMLTQTGPALSIFYNDKYEVLFDKSIKKEENLYDYIEINIIIDNSGARWQVSEITEDTDYYCYSYKTEFYSYDSNGERQIIFGLEEAKDQDFSDEFGIPLEIARNCRLNFQENIEYINECKKIASLKKLDEERECDRKEFTMPFKITEFATFISGVEDVTPTEGEEDTLEDEEEIIEDVLDDIDFDDDSIEETEQLDLETIYNRACNLQKNLINYLGVEGKFIMSVNMYASIENYINDKDELLVTTGIIIRKLSNTFTIYYTHITNEQIIIIPHEATKEEVVKLYKASPMNELVYGLPEFFEDTKNYKLKN